MGLSLVHPGDTSGGQAHNSVDIVFVHGLQGPLAHDTWKTESKPDAPWLYDLLSKSLPASRILVFGYEGGVTNLINSKGLDIAIHADRLLKSLTTFRTRFQKSPLRPVIFVAHSLGGLIVQRALVTASKGPWADFRSIQRSTSAILLFATPQYSDAEGILKSLRYFLSVEHNSNVNDSLRYQVTSCDDLSDTCAELRRIQEDFERLRIEQHFSFNIVLFFEELPVAGFGFVVDGTSAPKGSSNSILLHADHQTICKFDTVSEPNYKRVLAALKKAIVSSSGNVQSLQSHQQEISRWLATHNDSYILNPALPGTGDWLLENTQFRSWMTSDQNSVLWIQGSPGTGKSTLVANLIKNFELQHFDNQPPRLVYHFFRYGFAETLSSTLLRSLIFQIVSQTSNAMSDLVSLLTQERDIYHKLRAPCETWSERVSQTVFTPKFLQLCVGTATKRHGLYIVIDALDECPEEEVVSVMSHIYLINSTISDNPVKLCLTSRPDGLLYDQLFSRLPHHKIVLQNENHADIGQFIAFNMAMRFPNSSNQKEVSDALSERASGVFIWVKLVVHNLGKLTDYKTNATKDALSRVPISLQDLYNTIYEYVVHGESAAAQILLGWVVFARRPLSIDELRVALKVYQWSTTNSGLDSRNKRGSDEPILLTQAGINSIIASCRGLLEVQEPNGTVSLVHLSAREFLISRAAANNPTLGCSDDKYFKYTQTIIAQTCIGCLAYEAMNNESNEGHGPDISGFLEYSVLYWIEHAKAADISRLLYQPLLEASQLPFSNVLKFWIAQYQKHKNTGTSSRCMLKEWTALHISAAFGIHRLAEVILELGKKPACDIKDSFGRTPLSLAAENNHTAVVQLLLEAGASTTTRDSRFGFTPLEWAASQGNSDIVKLLLEATPSLRQALSLGVAAADGHGSIVRLLLEKDITIDSTKQYWGLTPIHLAAGYGHTDVVSLLLSHGVDPNIADESRGQTPLYYAIYGGHLSTVKILLKYGAKLGEYLTNLSEPRDAPGYNSWPHRVGSFLLENLEDKPRTCAGSAEANGNSSSGAGCSNAGSSGTSDSTCKKRSHQDSQDSGAGGNGNSEDGPNKQPALDPFIVNGPSIGGIKLNLACPYFKHDPGRYGSSRACRGPPGYPDMNRLKQHLYKAHSLKICRKCHLICINEVALQNHYDIPVCPSMFPQDYTDGFDDTQRDQLKKRTEKRNHPDKAQYWIAVYRILFPEVDDANIPSPWHEENVNKRLYDESCAVSRLQDSSLRNELLQHIHNPESINAVLNIINRHQAGSAATPTANMDSRSPCKITEQRQTAMDSETQMYQPPPLGRQSLNHDSSQMTSWLPPFVMDPPSDSGFYDEFSTFNDDFSLDTLSEVAGTITGDNETAFNLQDTTQHQSSTEALAVNNGSRPQSHEIPSSGVDYLVSSNINAAFDSDQNLNLRPQQDPVFANFQHAEFVPDAENNDNQHE